MRKWGKKVKKNVKEKVILKFNIPPLQNHCKSSCNFPKMWVLPPYDICSNTSASTFNFLILFFFEVTVILGFLIRSSYLRLMNSFFKILFFLFNFLVGVEWYYHELPCPIYFVPSKSHSPVWYVCSIYLIYKFPIWEHQLDVLVDWQKVLGSLRHFSSLVILYSHIYVVTLGLCLEIFYLGYLQNDEENFEDYVQKRG